MTTQLKIKHKLSEVSCWAAKLCMYELKAPNCFVMLLCHTFMTVCGDLVLRSLPLFLLMLPLSIDDACYTDLLTALYITGCTTFTSSIVLVQRCLPCVHHGLLHLCKTWLSICRRCCTVDVTAIQQKIYMCCIKI